MKQAMHAEWTKLRTQSGPGWLLLGAIALTVALSAAVAAAVEYSARGARLDITKVSLTGVVLGQAVIAGLAVLAISSEYGTGMISVTFSATPRRSIVLAAKAVVVSALTLVAGTIAVLGSLLTGRILLPRSGFTAAHGYAPLSLSDGPTLRAAAGSVLYLCLIALLALGAATIARDSATAIAAVLGLLYLFPIMAALIGDEQWRRHLERIGPMSAGLAIQTTTDLARLPISPWAGLGVLALWAAAGLVGGGLLLRFRDA